MHSLWLTGRLISRAIFNGLSNNLSTAADPNVQRRPDPQLISAVCGFSKERGIQRLIRGQFGDDAWFTAKHRSADVLGQYGVNFDPGDDMCPGDVIGEMPPLRRPCREPGADWPNGGWGSTWDGGEGIVDTLTVLSMSGGAFFFAI